MRVAIVLSALMFLTACGGNRFASAVTSGSNGGINGACLAADRRAATPALCSCVQRVANSELSRQDRNRIEAFFPDPEVAHAVRISDTPADDAFWRRYQAYVASARRQCG